jgi:hypothetical protein
MMDQSEAAVVQKQALQQAARFEVLRKEDVDNLSRVRAMILAHKNMDIDYLGYRNYDISMNEPSISDAPIPLSEPADVIFIRGYVNISAHPGLRSSTKCRCSSRRKHSPSSMLL